MLYKLNGHLFKVSLIVRALLWDFGTIRNTSERGQKKMVEMEGSGADSRFWFGADVKLEIIKDMECLQVKKIYEEV